MKANYGTKGIAGALALFLTGQSWGGAGVATVNAQTKRRDGIEPNIVLLDVLGLLNLFSIVGLTFKTHSARLNVTLIEVLPPGAIPPYEGEPVLVELLIYDVDGQILARSREWLTPDRTTSLRLGAEVLNITREPALIRAVVRTGRLRRRHKILSSLEIFDNATQQTTLLMKGEQFMLER